MTVCLPKEVSEGSAGCELWPGSVVASGSLLGGGECIERVEPGPGLCVV